MTSSPIILRRLVRLAAVPVAGLCLLFLAGAASAAPVQLTATVAPAAVVYPGEAVVGGTLSDGLEPLAGAALDLYQRPAGSVVDWLPAGSTTTSASGAFSFPVAPPVSTEYQVRYAGGDGVPAAQADVRLAVQPLVTFSAPQSLWLGDTILLRGEVAPAHPGASVTIERKVDGAWQPLLTATLDGDSRFSVSWTPGEYGYFRIRARMEPDAGHDTGVSTSRQVIVNRPNAHDVPLRYDHYIVIVRHEYRLYYYENGALVRAFDVALGKPGWRTPLGHFRIYGKRKPAGGALGACAMFYRRKGGIAIHGTNQPRLVRRPAPRAYSHGCARMLNRHVLWLYERVPVGTRVHNLR